MKFINTLDQDVKSVLQQGKLKKLRSLKLRKNGVYGKKCKTLLHLTAKYSPLKLVKYCISHLNQDPLQKTRHQNTALHYSSSSGNLQATKYLLKLSPSTLNSTNNKRQTPLLLSAKHNRPEVSIFLLKKSADPNTQDKKGWTAGHWAAYHGQLAVLQMLKQKKFDFSLKNKKQENLIHLAAWNGSIECFDFLLDLVSVKEESLTGDVIKYCKGNWKLLYWIFEKKILRGILFEESLYVNGAPAEIFTVANLEIKLHCVLMYDRDDLLRHLFSTWQIDFAFLKLLIKAPIYNGQKCLGIIGEMLRWQNIKCLVYWHRNVKPQMPRGILREIIKFF